MNLLKSKGVLVSMASVGCPEENGYAERWMRTLKEDKVMYLALERHSKSWRYAIPEWAEAKNHFAILFGERMPA